MTDVLRANDEALEKGTRKLFYADKNEAIKQLGAGGLNKIVSLDDTLEGMFKNGVLVNRLKGLHTTEEIADSFEAVNKLSNFFVKDGKVANAYKYVFLYPKAGAQVAKTVLSPTTHVRNFLSASAFSVANGTLFTNPALVKRAMAKAIKSVQLGVFATCAPAFGYKKTYLYAFAILPSLTKKLLSLFTASNESAISCVVCKPFSLLTSTPFLNIPSNVSSKDTILFKPPAPSCLIASFLSA